MYVHDEDIGVTALIVAAGRGSRAGQGLPKQYRTVGGIPVLTRTLQAFLGVQSIRHIQVVIHPDDLSLYESAVGSLVDEAGLRLRPPAMGGQTRCDTVRNGLAALAGVDDRAIVLIHDGARPFVTADLINHAIAHARQHGPCIPVLAVTDTIKQVGPDGEVTATLDRDRLRSVQTPQAFPLAIIRAAHAEAARQARSDFTDDGALIEWLGLPLCTFPGDVANIKLTTVQDFTQAEMRTSPSTALLTRVATGYDVHAFGPGDHIWLCGVRVPHVQGVVAHSDGDVALHALCDAIFGVIGDGDIGVHFPPGDEAWRGASSDQFLAYACSRLAARGGIIDHLDLSIVCERPRIGPHREAMRQRIASLADVDIEQIGLKATTSERLGFTGRSEGLAALATVTVRLPGRRGT
jgi:2-C-methyl-D-erythritol 4-phosphate cytidylyltransferase / 2-C-methyl-D-erythritol 2,4-cyclodiphosphate synthase